jgi:vacuolar-type H+-ATPase subunit D/Vma8
VEIWPWSQLNRIERKLDALTTKEDQLMATFADLIREVQETRAGVDSVLVFIEGLKLQLQALIDAGAPTAEQLQEVVDSLDADQARIAAAITTEPTP